MSFFRLKEKKTHIYRRGGCWCVAHPYVTVTLELDTFSDAKTVALFFRDMT